MVMGAIQGVDRDQHTPMLDAINSVYHINPELALYIFLPPLLFESSYGLNTHVLSQSLWSVMLLAVPGVLIFAALFAVSCVVMLDYEWESNWSIALLLGSMIR